MQVRGVSSCIAVVQLRLAAWDNFYCEEKVLMDRHALKIIETPRSTATDTVVIDASSRKLPFVHTSSLAMWQWQTDPSVHVFLALDEDQAVAIF